VSVAEAASGSSGPNWPRLRRAAILHVLSIGNHARKLWRGPTNRTPVSAARPMAFASAWARARAGRWSRAAGRRGASASAR